MDRCDGFLAGPRRGCEKYITELGICLRNGLARLRLKASEAPCDDSQGQAIPVPNDREMDIQILLAELHHQLPEFTSFLIFAASQIPENLEEVEDQMTTPNLKEVQEIYARDGVVLLKNILAEDWLERLRAAGRRRGQKRRKILRLQEHARAARHVSGLLPDVRHRAARGGSGGIELDVPHV